MLHIFKILFLLINIDQKTVLNWFGLEDSANQEIRQTIENGLDSNISNFESPTDVSLETFRLIITGWWDKIQNGLTLSDIENVLFFILFIRFVILAIRYNLKTSFYITCIGLVAGYLWYRHLIDIIFLYRSVLVNLPFLHSLGMESVQMSSLNRQASSDDLKLGENSHWYNPGQIIYYALTKGIVNIDPETGRRYYIDPISMVVANLEESSKSNIAIIYYKIYTKIIPKIFDICSKFWNQLSGILAYAMVTRIGKRYCPYLIRWHWTFLVIIGILEQILVSFVMRGFYFQTFVLLPQLKELNTSANSTLIFQGNLLNGILAFSVFTHIGLLIFGLFHAIWGQYFYFPFCVENTELHVGRRPKDSIYSGGQTEWQDQKEKNSNRVFPKLWFGWFGRGAKGDYYFANRMLRVMKKLLRKITKQFRR